MIEAHSFYICKFQWNYLSLYLWNQTSTEIYRHVSWSKVFPWLLKVRYLGIPDLNISIYQIVNEICSTKSFWKSQEGRIFSPPTNRLFIWKLAVHNNSRRYWIQPQIFRFYPVRSWLEIHGLPFARYSDVRGYRPVQIKFGLFPGQGSGFGFEAEIQLFFKNSSCRIKI